jgi:hypothetical protein
MYMSLILVAVQGADATSTYQNAQTNLANLFNNQVVGGELSETQVTYALTQDSNVYDATLTNFDSTIRINVYVATSEPDNQSEITPFGFYFETDTATPFLYYNIAARLWIGKPDVINSNNFVVGSGFNVTQPSQYSGVTDERIVRGVTTSWTTQVYPFYEILARLQVQMILLR